MVIAFANQKGGVGKSTICLSLANYWASQGLPVHIIDTDIQQSLTNIRKTELEEYPERHPLFDIEFNYIQDFMLELPSRRKNSNAHLLIDLPGAYDNDVIAVLRNADFIIVPFTYEETVLDTTSMFGTYLDIINETYPELKREVIFVPNLVNRSRGRKEDLEYWDEWKAGIEEVATLSPPICDRVCMQRRSSMFLNAEERACVTECFEFITGIVFKQQLNNENKEKL